MTIEESKLQGIAFVGNVLAPFFLEDPRTGKAGDTFAAFAALDGDSAARDWPFVDTDEACWQSGMMQEGLAASLAAGEEGVFVADDDLTWEYRRLFVGPNALPAPPWGSVYTDRECVMFGHTAQDLHEWMRKHGVARFSDEKTPDDHVGLMLYLMAWLAQHQPADVEEFLQLHFLPWAGHLLGELATHTEHPFYRGLALLTHASLDGIQADLGLDVKEPPFFR